MDLDSQSHQYSVSKEIPGVEQDELHSFDASG
jgi:hypothetical protein